MDYRIGKCSQCGAEYKIPASFAHDRARCKQCQGVVNIAPLGAAPEAAAPPPPPKPAAPPPAPTAIPARKVVPAPAAEAPPPPRPPVEPPKPAPRPLEPARAEPPKADEGAARKGGTLERLKAERRAAAAAAGTPEPRAAPASKPAARPAAPSASASRATARPAAPAARSAKPSARRKASDEEAAGSKAGGRSGGRRAARGGGGGREKKKKPVAGLISIVALVVVGAGVFLFKDSLFGSGKPEVEAASEESAANATPAPEETKAPEVTTPEPEPEVAETPAAEPEPEAPKAPKTRDPASIDLAAIPALTRTPDTTAEEWSTMEDQMAQWMDRDAGAAANRAKLALVEKGRKAVPVILNFFKGLDFSTKEGRDNGDQCQKTLQDICNGTNFDWKYADPAAGRDYDDPDDVWFCKRVVELWIGSWKQGEENIEAWIRMAKLDEKNPEEAARLRAEFGNKTATGEPADPVQSGSDDDLEVD